MCLERIAKGAQRFVIHTEAIPPQTQFNKVSIFSESVRCCKNLSVADTDIKVLGKVLPEAFQTTVSAQTIQVASDGSL
jgi:hypothetical protein